MKQEGLWIDGVFIEKPTYLKQEHLDFLDEFLPIEKYSLGALIAAFCEQFQTLWGHEVRKILDYWKATRG